MQQTHQRRIFCQVFLRLCWQRRRIHTSVFYGTSFFLLSAWATLHKPTLWMKPPKALNDRWVWTEEKESIKRKDILPAFCSFLAMPPTLHSFSTSSVTPMPFLCQSKEVTKPVAVPVSLRTFHLLHSCSAQMSQEKAKAWRHGCADKCIQQSKSKVIK